jgi:hypothetical protein
MTAGTESATESGVDIVLNHRLVETGFGTKNDYMVYLKDYMKKVNLSLYLWMFDAIYCPFNRQKFQKECTSEREYSRVFLSASNDCIFNSQGVMCR